tara:strand:- start:132 stop:959 length:828 start_codon:yes stop_codon:yes gene_type:complete
MAIVVRTNPASIFSQHRLSRTSDQLGKTFQRLASGARINSAADDAAGLAISTLLEHRIRGQAAAKHNAQEGISLVQTLEGGVEQIRSILDRMRELAVRAGNATLNNADRNASNLEYTQLIAEVRRIAATTTFNNGATINASLELTFQVGFVDSGDDRITATVDFSMQASSLGISNSTISQQGSAQGALALISTALSQVNQYRSQLGAVQNRLERAISNLEADIENATASNSRIRDVDFAEETSRMTRLQILTQSGTAVLGQANAAPQAALALLGG